MIKNALNKYECLERIRSHDRTWDAICLQRQKRTNSQGQDAQYSIAYSNQHIDIEIPHGSRDHVIVPDTVKITFNLNTESTDKARSVVNNVGKS